MHKQPVVLVILDGFGYSTTSTSNAIEQARTPTWDRLCQQYPHSLIETSGLAVGLPPGQMGNSEVGHMNLGAGRIVYQNLTRISKAIDEGDFYSNPVLCQAVDRAVSRGKAVHIMGLLSEGGVHSHQSHLLAMLSLAAQRGAKTIYVHAFLDGRDTPPRSAQASILAVQQHLQHLGVGQIASLIGRYYAMDRDQRWDRVQKAYDLLTQGQADWVAQDALQGLQQAYAAGIDDEFVPAIAVRGQGEAPVCLQQGDSLVFMNFRPDRARALTQALLQDSLQSTLDRRVRPKLGDFVMLTDYTDQVTAHCAYPTQTLQQTVGECVAQQGMTQLRIAETEKYAHVTFFFSGGREEPFEGGNRTRIPSPVVATYDLQPQMSAPELTQQLVGAIEQGHYDLIVCNYANGDMVGHTGNFAAAVQAVETLDACLQQVTDAVVRAGGHCLITADHGNVEVMVDPQTAQPMTSHTTNPVPLVYVSPQAQHCSLGAGKLSDIAPTLLQLLHLEQPAQMSGQSLITLLG